VVVVVGEVQVVARAGGRLAMCVCSRSRSRSSGRRRRSGRSLDAQSNRGGDGDGTQCRDGGFFEVEFPPGAMLGWPPGQSSAGRVDGRTDADAAELRRDRLLYFRPESKMEAKAQAEQSTPPTQVSGRVTVDKVVVR
jgi:hypothetical protein